MPCYCDIPDEKDQQTIERRCKVNMYFDAQANLTDAQVEECEKLGLKQFPIGDINSLLCKMCTVLSDSQMKEISAYYYHIKWPHKTLYDWNIQHMKDDAGDTD